MIVVKIMGGIGNQLFQYALGRNLAVKNNTDLKLDLSSFKNNPTRIFALNAFNIRATEATPKQIPYYKRDIRKSKLRSRFSEYFNLCSPVYDESHFHFDENVLNCKSPKYLFGYWQSERYFKEISSVIKADLTLKKPTNKKVSAVANLIKKKNSISLHIRRGDYLNNQTHPILSLDYYSKGLALLEPKLKNPAIFIFSDDINWCKANLNLNQEHYFVDGNKDWEDLYLISLCENHIIANSSFSWWGAWLSDFKDKIVIAPNNWFTPNDYLTQDLVPKNWIKI